MRSVRRLAAARRAHQDHEFAIFDVHIESVDDPNAVLVHLDDVLKNYACHVLFFSYTSPHRCLRHRACDAWFGIILRETHLASISWPLLCALWIARVEAGSGRLVPKAASVLPRCAKKTYISMIQNGRPGRPPGPVDCEGSVHDRGAWAPLPPRPVNHETHALVLDSPGDFGVGLHHGPRTTRATLRAREAATPSRVARRCCSTTSRGGSTKAGQPWSASADQNNLGSAAAFAVEDGGKVGKAAHFNRQAR